MGRSRYPGAMTGLSFLLLDPTSGGRPLDRGLLVLVLALIFAAILAHRFWRRTIRLEDELARTTQDLTFHLGRYRRAWRGLQAQAALAERGTGLVTEATPGWEAAGLPAKGELVHRGEAGAQAAWSAIPAPTAEGAPAPAFRFELGGRRLRATPLAEESLGLVLIEPE